MAGKNIRLIGAFILLVAMILPGCIKIDNLPQLSIQVLDEAGVPVVGAYVALFDSAEKWNTRKNPVQVWRQTNTDGVAEFIDLNEITYYIYVRYDGKDNSVGEVYASQPLVNNQRDQIVIHIR